MLTIESGPFVKIAKDENQARSIIDSFIGEDTNDYSLTYDITNGVFKVYDDTLDGMCVLIITVKGE